MVWIGAPAPVTASLSRLWAVEPPSNTLIQAGATIVVESIQGVKLMVRLQEAAAAGTTQAQSLSK